MALPIRKYVLVIFCVSGSANILYLILSNNHTTISRTEGITTISQTLPGRETDDIKRTIFSPDARKLTDVNHLDQEVISGTLPENKSIHLNVTKFMFEINQPDICKPTQGTKGISLDLIVVVISDIKNFIRRMAIRNTWGSDVYGNFTNVRLLFLVGRSSDERFQPQIEKESELFNDIIQANIHEAYENLTNKSLAMLQWIHDHCLSARFVLKSDDDMYVNIPNLVKELLKRRTPKFFYCYVFKGAPPIRDKTSKWYTSVEEYSHTYFPKYCSGTAYAYSANIASDLFESSKRTKLLKMEDVYITGLLAQNLNIPLIHGDGFWFLKRKSTGCDYEKAISGHEVPVKEMYIIHAQLHDTAIDCKTNTNKAILGDDKDMFQQWQQSDVT